MGQPGIIPEKLFPIFALSYCCNTLLSRLYVAKYVKPGAVYIANTMGEEIRQTFIRIINENLSIRNGKFGDYIFYKTKTMKKPKFFKLKGVKEDYKTCELSILIKWINEIYSAF